MLLLPPKIMSLSPLPKMSSEPSVIATTVRARSAVRASASKTRPFTWLWSLAPPITTSQGAITGGLAPFGFMK